MKDHYLVGKCPRCHMLIIADSRYKSKTCPNCNARIPLSDIRVIQTAHDSREARTILAEAKARRGRLDQR